MLSSCLPAQHICNNHLDKAGNYICEADHNDQHENSEMSVGLKMSTKKSLATFMPLRLVKPNTTKMIPHFPNWALSILFILSMWLFFKSTLSSSSACVIMAASLITSSSLCLNCFRISIILSLFPALANSFGVEMREKRARNNTA